MSLKTKLLSLAVTGAVSALGVQNAHAAASISLNLVYIGSTTGNASLANRIAQNSGTGVINNSTNISNGSITTVKSGLTQMDLSAAATQQTAGLKNYFAVYGNYTPNNAGTDALFGDAFNVVLTGNLASVSSTNSTANNIQKWIAYNPGDDNTGATTWDQAGDLGTFAGDLQGVAFYQSDFSKAYIMGVGTPNADGTAASGVAGVGYNSTTQGQGALGAANQNGSLLGFFAVQFTGVGSGTVALQYGGAGNFQYYDNPSTGHASINDLGTTSTPFVIGVPEPASLGVLALGGLALIARRRKSA